MSDEPSPAPPPRVSRGSTRTAPESTDLVRLEDRYGLFIGGEFVEPKSGRYFATIDPSTEEPLAEVAEAGREDVDLAVTAARAASSSSGATCRAPNARSTSTGSRATPGALARVRRARIDERRQADQGIRDVDLPLAAAHFFYYAGWADKLEYAFPGRRPGRSASPDR